MSDSMYNIGEALLEPRHANVQTSLPVLVLHQSVQPKGADKTQRHQTC